MNQGKLKDKRTYGTNAGEVKATPVSIQKAVQQHLNSEEECAV